jgi:hypothetical protein
VSDNGLGHVFKSTIGIEVFKQKVSKIHVGFKVVKGFLEDPILMLNPFRTYSSDAFLQVDLYSDGLLTITFGSKVTVADCKVLYFVSIYL